MQITLVGLTKSGKTTVFNALSSTAAPTSAHGGTLAKVHLGAAKVPDPRLRVLNESFRPKRLVPAEVNYVDLPAGVKGFTASEEIAGPFLTYLQQADALLHVVRGFHDPSLPPASGQVDPARDVATFQLELALADLSLLERQSQRLENAQKSNKPQEREAAARKLELISRMISSLEHEKAVREQSLAKEEFKALASYGLLTAKPVLVVINIGEESLAHASRMESDLQARFEQPLVKVVVMCGKIEAELAQMTDADAEEFRQSMGLAEAGLHRVIKASYQLLGLQTFFTVGSDEVRAWTVSRGLPAQRAAGKVHSDIERGFIRARVLGYQDFLRLNPQSGSGEKLLVEARKRGVLRQEGKTYPIEDGDIIEYLFNV